jgi:RNA polymerase sigma-70 factor, ECF subfamily
MNTIASETRTPILKVIKPAGGASLDAITFQTEAMKLEKLLYHISWSMLSNNEDCADAVQEALTRAWQKRDTLQSMRTFRPWLTRILYNVCVDILRTRKHLSNEPLDENLATDTRVSADGDEMLEALRRLSLEQRTAIVMHYWEGYKLREIADILQISINTVKSRLMYARMYLKQDLLRYDSERSVNS